MKDPEDIRYRIIENIIRSIPIVVAFLLISATTQLRSNNVFDGNEIQNLVEGAPAMAVAYALLKLKKLV
jgi:hypothetical protein